MRAILLSLTLAAPSLFVPATAAQTPAKDIYAGESFVVVRADSLYSMNADGTGYKQRTFAVRIQSEAALRALSVVNVPFASAHEHVEFHYVRARHPDNSVTETSSTAVIEQPEEVTRQAPFYSDLKEAQLPVKNLRVGDTLEWEARVIRTRAEAPNRFWGEESFLDDTAVSLEQSVELHVPLATSPNVWTNPRLGVKPTETQTATEHIYRWQSAQLKPTTSPEAEAAQKAKKARQLTPDEVLDAEKGKLPDIAWSTFKSWPEVGAWYRGLVGTRSTPDDEIKTKVAELTAGSKTPEDKARAIYAYVSTNIRYIGVDFGVGRYQPHEAVEVLHNQYGDCKDKATLLSAMLAAAGIDSDSVLIGAGIRFNEAVPSPAAFNHLISHLMLDGKDVWLDATEEVAPFRMLAQVIRDQEALIVPTKGEARLAKTPEQIPFPSEDTWTAKGSIDAKGISDSHIVMTLRGDDELGVRSTLRQVPPANYPEFLQKFIQAFGYAGTTSHAEITRPEDTADPLRLSFDYHRERGSDWDNLRLLPQLEPVFLPVVNEKEPPVAPLLLGSPRTERSIAEMKLPEGWRVELPEAIHAKCPYATYDVTYRFDQGVVSVERKTTILLSKVPVDDWKAYKKFTDAGEIGNDTYITLLRGDGQSISDSKTEETPSTPDTSDSKRPEALLQKAGEALRRMDIKAARSYLDQAKAINPRLRHLWAAYGALALSLGTPMEAIEDFRKELTLYPETRELYGAIAQAQMMHKDLDASAETLRTWIFADPSDARPVATLGLVLFDQKKYAEATESLEKACTLDPANLKNERLQLLLGEAQMRAEQKTKAGLTLSSLLKSTEDPNMLNDAAYELADAGMELPLDEEKERLALEKLTAETQTWTLDEAPTTLKQKTSLLIASWDTMGWILFREGKAKEAQSYIDAAWWAKPGTEEKKHYEAVNKALGLDTPEKPKQKIKADVTVTADAVPSEEVRSIPLGHAPKALDHGFASFLLLLYEGKLQRSLPTGNQKFDDAETFLQHVDYSKLFPAGVSAKLALSVTVQCFSSTCSLVLNP